MQGIKRIFEEDKMTIGLELPLDNDWSADGNQKRILEERPFGFLT